MGKKKINKLTNNPWENPGGPLWPGGVVARACRPCRTYVANEGLCPHCGGETVEILVFNTPEPEGASDSLGLRRRFYGRMYAHPRPAPAKRT